MGGFEIGMVTVMGGSYWHFYKKLGYSCDDADDF
jgi:hypothetical protein